ncbi:unnamed protein product [Amoebophrya sp. A120]|nr:unnamed protein product [Amoebophrya sp. A120]|eukprot:GSA120T00006996001.1
MATDDKYDRQKRLWGASGQEQLAKANVLVLGSSVLLCEVAKNLILPGVGKVLILDDAVVTETDYRTNFFVSRKNAICSGGGGVGGGAAGGRNQEGNSNLSAPGMIINRGQHATTTRTTLRNKSPSRAEVVAQSLQILNPDCEVVGKHFDITERTVAGKNDDGYNSSISDDSSTMHHFDLVILDEGKNSKLLSKLLSSPTSTCVKLRNAIANTKVVIRCVSRGFVGGCFLCATPGRRSAGKDSFSSTSTSTSSSTSITSSFSSDHIVLDAKPEGQQLLKHQLRLVVPTVLTSRGGCTNTTTTVEQVGKQEISSLQPPIAEFIRKEYKNTSASCTSGAVGGVQVQTSQPSANQSSSTTFDPEPRKLASTSPKSTGASNPKKSSRTTLLSETSTPAQHQKLPLFATEAGGSSSGASAATTTTPASAQAQSQITSDVERSFFINLLPSIQDSNIHAHVPFPVILYCAKKKYESLGNKQLKTREEKDSFKEVIKSFRNSVDELNFQEALDYSYLMHDLPGGAASRTASTVPDDTRDALESLSAGDPSLSRLPLKAKAILSFCEEFRCLPLSGQLPDMTTSTESYVKLQEFFREKANEDFQYVRKKYEEMMMNDAARGSSSSADEDLKELETLCKNAFSLRKIPLIPLDRDTFEMMSSPDRSTSPQTKTPYLPADSWDEFCMLEEDEEELQKSLLPWFVGLQIVLEREKKLMADGNKDLLDTASLHHNENTSTTSRTAGRGTSPVYNNSSISETELLQLFQRNMEISNTTDDRVPASNGAGAVAMEVDSVLSDHPQGGRVEDQHIAEGQDEEQNSGPLSPPPPKVLAHLKKVIDEISRCQGELHTTSSLVGGIVAQEAVKLITQTHVPMSNAMVYCGHLSKCEVLQL